MSIISFKTEAEKEAYLKGYEDGLKKEMKAHASEVAKLKQTIEALRRINNEGLKIEGTDGTKDLITLARDIEARR